MTELICILCPKGCHLRVDEQNGYAVSGNGCPRGVGYGQKELQNPTRTLTSTVRLRGARIPRLPVKTSGEIPKRQMMAAARLLNGVVVEAPVKAGDVVLENVLSSGVDVVATRTLEDYNAYKD